GRHFQAGKRRGGWSVGCDHHSFALHLLAADQRDSNRTFVRLDETFNARLQSDRARRQMRHELRRYLADAALRDGSLAACEHLEEEVERARAAGKLTVEKGAAKEGSREAGDEAILAEVTTAQFVIYAAVALAHAPVKDLVERATAGSAAQAEQ